MTICSRHLEYPVLLNVELHLADLPYRIAALNTMEESIVRDSTFLVDSTTTLLVAQYCRMPAKRIQAILQESGAVLTNNNRMPGRIPVAAANAIWREANRINPDPLLPLRCAQIVPPGAFRTVDMLLLHSPTLLEGLENCRRTFSLVNQAFQFEIRREQSYAEISLHSLLDEELMSNAYAEYVLLLLLLRCQASRRSRTFPLLEIHLRSDSEDKIAGYQKEFRCRILANQPVHRLILPMEPLTASQPFADAGLTDVLMQYASRLMQEQQEQLPLLIQLVAHIIENNLPESGSKLSIIARKIAMSERTLQRALRAYGTTLRALQDDVRKRKFHRLIAQGMRNLDEISYSLGFSDIRSFYRRVQAWTGTSPASYIKRISQQTTQEN